MAKPRKTPAAVIAAGILLTVYGALSLICGICGGIGLAVSDPQAEAMLVQEVPGFTIAKFAEPISNLLVAVTMIASGIGLFLLIRAARTLAYVVLTYQILFVILRNLYQVIFVFPMMERILGPQLQMQNQGQPMPFDIGGLMKGTMWVTVILLVAFHFSMILATLFFLSVPSARKAFSGEAQPDDGNDERRPRDEDGYDDDDYDPPPPPPKDTGNTGIKGGF
jgi:hypothetical protein